MIPSISIPVLLVLLTMTTVRELNAESTVRAWTVLAFAIPDSQGHNARSPRSPTAPTAAVAMAFPAQSRTMPRGACAVHGTLELTAARLLVVLPWTIAVAMASVLLALLVVVISAGRDGHALKRSKGT